MLLSVVVGVALIAYHNKLATLFVSTIERRWSKIPSVLPKKDYVKSRPWIVRAYAWAIMIAGVVLIVFAYMDYSAAGK